jgi:endoglycosylceramidase
MKAMRRTAALLLALVIVAVGVGACSSSDESSDTTDATDLVRVDGSAFTAEDLSPLSLERGEHARIVDADGNQVLLRGANLNTLGDYYQADPDLDPTFPYDEADFAEMATLGFDVVRLLVSWSLLEPAPGQIDETYLARIHDAVDAAAAQGLYTVIDMHQDAYGKFVATPDGTTCPDDLQPAIGWDGAPEWATITDGRSTCNTGMRESAGAVIAAFNNFWADTDGIQTHLVDVWERLSEEFAAEPAVAGYDLLNEPGFGPGVDDTNTAMAEFYVRAIAAVRRGEASVDDSTAHLIFFEPVILWSGLGDAPVPEPFSDDPGLVFAPHLYAESITAGDISVAEGFAAADEKARGYGTTFWVGEYGWFGDPDEQAGAVAEYANQEDRYRVGGTWWQWRQACGDPHSVGTPDGTPADLLVHLHRTSCPDGENLGLTEPWATTLSRTYPRSAPGRLIRMGVDVVTGAARVKGTVEGGADATGTLVLWVPDRDQGTPLVSGGVGGNQAAVTAGDGGFRVEIPVAGTYDVRVNPSGAVQVTGG